MNRVRIHFHGRLNYFLPKKRCDVEFDHLFDKSPSVKDMIEALGPPHPEVEAILVNGQAVTYDYLVQDGDQIGVYADLAEAGTPIVNVRPPELAEARFILDVHLGRLSAQLRMLGFDTLYRNDYEDDELARVSCDEARIVLTRDMGVLKRGIVVYGYYVRETSPTRQIVELVRRYRLHQAIRPFYRCTECNGLLASVDKAAISDRLEARTLQFYHEFRMCQSCGQIYWKGTHFERMQQFIESNQNDTL